MIIAMIIDFTFGALIAQVCDESAGRHVSANKCLDASLHAVPDYLELCKHICWM